MPEEEQEPHQHPSSSSSSFDLPRPSEIPYQSKVANLVNLIGHIQSPIKFQKSPDGKNWAGTLICQEDGHERPCLIPLLFEDDLAHVVTFHVKEKDCVYVSGYLIGDPMPFPVCQTPTRCHLRVLNINFVQGYEKKISDKPRRRRERFRGKSLSESSDKFDSWRDLVENSRQWRDYREQKFKGLVTNKYPDFKHRETGAALWIGKAPKWVMERLESLDFDQVKDHGGKEEIWKSLVENPNQWWDNRLDKKHPKAPDFRNKENGQGLWLDTLPDWVLSKLPQPTTTGRGKGNGKGSKEE